MLTALSIDCQVSASPATDATAMALGGLLLARAVAVKRAASKWSKSLRELKPVRMRSRDNVDLNHP